MASFKILKTIETHTGGQPTRIVIGGLPDFSGQSVSEKRMCAKKNYDSIRKFLCFEPRGHAAMYSAYLVESNLADLGVIFCSQVGYDDMCGHGIIGVVTAIIEEGVMPFKDQISVETPSGVVSAKVCKRAEKVHSVSFRCVTSFTYKKDLSINVPGFGTLCGDIAFGGNWYFYVNADSLGIKISSENIVKFLKLGSAIKEVWNDNNTLMHPVNSNVSQNLLGVSFFSTATRNETVISQKNLVVESSSFFDRSPCGTGTAGRMAILNARGHLPVGASFENISITGSRFTGTVLLNVKQGPFIGVVSMLTGSATVIGSAEWNFDQEDYFGFIDLNLE